MSGLNFVLNYLDVTTTLQQQISFDAGLAQEQIRGHCFATTTCKKEHFQNVFKFKSLNINVNDLSGAPGATTTLDNTDIMYRQYPGNWGITLPNLPINFSASTFVDEITNSSAVPNFVILQQGVVGNGNTELSSGQGGSDKGPVLPESVVGSSKNRIKHDMVRHLAKAITGGYGGSDIFGNEDALIADVVTKDISLNEQIKSKLAGAAAIMDSNETGDQNMARILLNGCLNDATRRNQVIINMKAVYDDLKTKSDVSGNPYVDASGQWTIDANNQLLADRDDKLWVKVPVEAGDKMYIRAHYNGNGGANNPAKDSNGADLGSNKIGTRTYVVEVTLN